MTVSGRMPGYSSALTFIQPWGDSTRTQSPLLIPRAFRGIGMYVECGIRVDLTQVGNVPLPRSGVDVRGMVVGENEGIFLCQLRGARDALGGSFHSGRGL